MSEPIEGHLVHGAIWTIKELYTYPNEYLYWTVHIVIYPFLTGLVAGAFVLSSLYHVFGKNELKPVSKFALVFSLALLIMAPTPLLFHLTKPWRALNTMLTPHFYSAISAFIFVYLTYMSIVVAEVWFVFRPFIVQQAREKTGYLGLLYKVLTLGSYDVSERALALDHKISKILAAVGIPAAALLHGYVGFIFGSVKTVPLWKTPLMPFIFLMSAVISGLAICIATYIAVMTFKKTYICLTTVRSMGKTLTLFLIIAFLLESLDIVFHAYTAEEFWVILSEIIFHRFSVNILVLQWGLGMIVPLVLLLIPNAGLIRSFVASCLVVFGVFMMRWDVVIGGQSMSRSLAGFMEFKMPILPTSIDAFREGLIVVIFLLVMPFVLLYVFNKVLPVFRDIFTEEECEIHTKEISRKEAHT
ncbi:MAG: polysulfide reductase NrfD [Candidatus Magnetoovum sp. WYHC-5]|nr:polysulfide reductase NrfD [Candidatus Magnetoovum sp. WYHC-5]